MPYIPLISEHLINYIYKGAERTMLVRKKVTEFEKTYIIRTRKGEVTLQYYDFRWNVISPVKMDNTLSQIIGDAIWAAGL